MQPGGVEDWVPAVLNRPLTTGDRLWADNDSRAELTIGSAALRIGNQSALSVVNLGDNIAQFELDQGSMSLWVRSVDRDDSIEIDTPNIAFTVTRPGEYRIDVDPDQDRTWVTVRRGEAEAYGQEGSLIVQQGELFEFSNGQSGQYAISDPYPRDDFEQWSADRERRAVRSVSARYCAPGTIGYEALDDSGDWRPMETYGSVWFPRVGADWAPYRDGHWAWIDPWGWTWVDDAPWGYAVSHYGRWANIRGSWGWVPGPPREQAVYAPALVAFVGGQNSRDTPSVGGTIAALVGWFPLAPREVYQPSYQVSRGYFDNINRSNAVIAPATITNVYNITNNTTIINNSSAVTKVVYANQQVTGAVVAVPAQAFAQSQPVAKAVVPVSKEAAISAPVARVAAVAPVQQSVQGGAPTAGAKPPASERAVVARTAPPPPPVAFAVQQQQLAAKPGTPIDQAQRNQLKPAITSAPKVSVVATAQAPAPSAPPPATPPAAKSPDARRADAAKADAPKPDAVKTDAAKGDAAKMDAAKAEAAKAEAAGHQDHPILDLAGERFAADE
jgi:hypothetical protein